MIDFQTVEETDAGDFNEEVTNVSDPPVLQESLEEIDDNESAAELFDLTSPNPPVYPQLNDRIQFLDKDKETCPPALVKAHVTRQLRANTQKQCGSMFKEDCESGADLLNK